LPTFFPPKRRLGHRSIHGEPCPVNASQGIVFSHATRPQLKEYASRRPFLEATMGRATGTEAGVIQGIPLATGAKDEEDSIHGLAVIHARPMAPQGVRFARWEQRLDVLPQLVRNMPITADCLMVVIHQQGSCRREVFPTEYHHNSLLG
jgi:hypothetical protein